MSSSASRVIVNTPLEAQQMGEYYGTDPQKLAIIPRVLTSQFSVRFLACIRSMTPRRLVAALCLPVGLSR